MTDFCRNVLLLKILYIINCRLIHSLCRYMHIILSYNMMLTFQYFECIGIRFVLFRSDNIRKLCTFILSFALFNCSWVRIKTVRAPNMFYWHQKETAKICFSMNTKKKGYCNLAQVVTWQIWLHKNVFWVLQSCFRYSAFSYRLILNKA
jgi:hypothetical protein